MYKKDHRKLICMSFSYVKRKRKLTVNNFFETLVFNQDE